MALSTAITPVLRYRDAGAAARWLCEAFGFQEHARAQELNGRVRYVSLLLGDNIVLVRSVTGSAIDDLMVQPEAIGGANTQICYLTVPDVASHHARAERAGAKVELDPQDDGLGGRFYTCRDPEGHLWSFGTLTYGVAHEAASAFEPVVLDPSLSNTAIAAPLRHMARERGTRGRLLLLTAITVATGALVAGGWAYYYSAGESLRDVETRLEDTVKQLADEHSRRLVAEAASTEATKGLAEERTVVARLRREKDEAIHALKSANELSQKRRLAAERAEAELAVAKAHLAEAKGKLAQLASEEIAGARAQEKEQQVDSRVKEELQEVKTALLEAQKKIEELRAGQFEPMVADGGDHVTENSLCVLAVQGKMASSHKGPTTWSADNLDRLCRGAEASAEPGKCFEEIMRGRVNWGASTAWATTNALALCGGTRNARRTLDCFTRGISSGEAWQVAIRQCRSK